MMMMMMSDSVQTSHRTGRQTDRDAHRHGVKRDVEIMGDRCPVEREGEGQIVLLNQFSRSVLPYILTLDKE